MDLSKEIKEKEYINKWMPQILELEEKYRDNLFTCYKDEGCVTIDLNTFFRMFCYMMDKGDFYVLMGSGKIVQTLNSEFNKHRPLNIKLIINNDLKDVGYLFALTIDNPFEIRKEWCVKYIDDYSEGFKNYLKEKI